jgi:adenylate cyclase
MEIILKTELEKLARQYLRVALSHIDSNVNLTERQKKALVNNTLSEQAELPGYEERRFHFGKFENREFVAMMTDIRDSTSIINSENGLVKMFLIFYVYAGIVAKIVDKHNGTSTEFLGDGVLNLFGIKEHGQDQALRNSIQAAWDIMDAKDQILNPLFYEYDLPKIEYGIGIDHGITIVTHFGYRSDTDLKAFGRCVYNASKLSKLPNQIVVSENSKSVWPSAPGGMLLFGNYQNIDGNPAFIANKLN